MSLASGWRSRSFPIQAARGQEMLVVVVRSARRSLGLALGLGGE